MTALRTRCIVRALSAVRRLSGARKALYAKARQIACSVSSPTNEKFRRRRSLWSEPKPNSTGSPSLSLDGQTSAHEIAMGAMLEVDVILGVDDGAAGGRDGR
jgi:hypothetical protein